MFFCIFTKKVVPLRPIMIRFIVTRTLKSLFHLHYDVRIEGDEILREKHTYLVLPNHTAYIDPLLLITELWRLPIRPLVDELFTRHWLYGRILGHVGAIEVPDLQKSKLSREEGAQMAQHLSEEVISLLKTGEHICFYPSGHIKTIDKEMIGNRRLAYEVCSALPKGVRVITCRMRGLESSRWSKLKEKKWKWRRTVVLHFEDHTDDVRLWAKQLDRRSFNQQLETWYNSL